MRIVSCLLLLFLIAHELVAQVAVSSTPAVPDNSAMVDIRATTKGLLIPRMTTAQRVIIATPADGLQVYDTDTKSIWIYNTGTNAGWKELGIKNKVAFRAYATIDQLFTSSSPMNFAGEDFDEGNNFNSGFGYFETPSTGVYSFQANASVNNAGSFYQFSVYVTPAGGGSANRVITNIVRPTTINFVVASNMSFTLRLNAGELVRLWIEPLGNATVKSGSDYSWWSGFKVL
jgi:hypothetical protein